MTTKKTHTTNTTPKSVNQIKDKRCLTIEDRIEAFVYANCFNDSASGSTQFDDEACVFSFKIDPTYARTYQNSIPFTHRVKVEGITNMVVIASLKEIEDGCQVTYSFHAITK